MESSKYANESGKDTKSNSNNAQCIRQQQQQQQQQELPDIIAEKSTGYTYMFFNFCFLFIYLFIFLQTIANFLFLIRFVCVASQK